MRSFKSASFLIFLATFLSACAAGTGPETEGLSKITGSTKKITLKSDMYYDNSALGRITRYNIKSGDYLLEASNALGDFYVGQNGNIWWTISDGKTFAFKGGLWIPHDPNKTPRLFTHVKYPYNPNTTSTESNTSSAEINKTANSLAIQQSGSTASPQVTAAGGLLAGVILNEFDKAANDPKEDPVSLLPLPIEGSPFIKEIRSLSK